MYWDENNFPLHSKILYAHTSDEPNQAVNPFCQPLKEHSLLFRQEIRSQKHGIELLIRSGFGKGFGILSIDGELPAPGKR